MVLFCKGYKNTFDFITSIYGCILASVSFSSYCTISIGTETYLTKKYKCPSNSCIYVAPHARRMPHAVDLGPGTDLSIFRSHPFTRAKDESGAFFDIAWAEIREPR